MALPFHPFSSLLLVLISPPQEWLFLDCKEAFSSSSGEQCREKFELGTSLPRSSVRRGCPRRAHVASSALGNGSLSPFKSHALHRDVPLFLSLFVLTHSLSLSAAKLGFSTHPSTITRTSFCRVFNSEISLCSHPELRYSRLSYPIVANCRKEYSKFLVMSTRLHCAEPKWR